MQPDGKQPQPAASRRCYPAWKTITATTITVEATLQPDGVTLRLETKLALPPGRVTVTVQPPGPGPGPTMLEVLDRIHQDQRQRGRTPMTEEEMAAEIAQLRAEGDDYEARWRQIWSETGTKGPRSG
jgi:hypothetical protein